jgi:hypothetical protein
VSEVTVNIHRGQAMRKMRATSLAELVRMASRLELSTKDTQRDLQFGVVSPACFVMRPFPIVWETLQGCDGL